MKKWQHYRSLFYEDLYIELIIVIN